MNNQFSILDGIKLKNNEKLTKTKRKQNVSLNDEPGETVELA